MSPTTPARMNSKQFLSGMRPRKLGNVFRYVQFVALWLQCEVNPRWPFDARGLFGVIRIERSEIIQVLLDDPIALARPLL
jgi:hypothetical protein